MTTVGESSLAPPKSTDDDKPVIVRVKRKASQSCLDALWLEISERPLKRPLLDFENLSISNSSGKEEFKTKKVLVQHVETIRSSETTIDVVQSFVEPNSVDASEGKTNFEERKRAFKKENRQGQLLSKARQEQEVLAKNARFEQIWRSRRENKVATHHKALDEMCRFYDVVRVDVEERSKKVQQQEDISLEDQRLLSSYLPLLREFIPSAASEIESDLHGSMSEQDDYVYDFYIKRDDMVITHEDVPIPLVQVDEDDFYDGPDESEYDTDDSNAEDNPLNDYPDEISEDEEEVVSEASENESEEKESESESNMSLKSEDLDQHGLLDDAELSGNESEKESESENNRSLKPEDLDQHDVLDDAELSHDTEIDDHYNYRGDDFDYPYDDDDGGHDDEEWRWVNEH
ncbi:RNA-directed DNA methylation 4 isoform X2 [Alnus glutinosa]|uniref:RNA-directed DNA methylation 4 isoform X2 n=1 Tax=Alnus glutinosa TaxID=3517 RepID=UPI002D76C522|nr:RNA-directed DNA methylation 4 isoform X2 [Alnus glutinosa]